MNSQHMIAGLFRFDGVRCNLSNYSTSFSTARLIHPIWAVQSIRFDTSDVKVSLLYLTSGISNFGNCNCLRFDTFF